MDAASQARQFHLSVMGSGNCSRQTSLPALVSLLACCRGLEQSVALPHDSYLQHYYDDVFASLR